MNIDKLREESAAQAAQRAVGISAIRRQPVVESDSSVAGDQVDMSMIGRLMARSIRMLADSEEVRPEVIAKYQQLPRQNVRFDDNTLDRLFSRMRNP